MASHNPLLGSRISLISKKNIRYEGTLYSINEADATVALQNVRTYGTEGREKAENEMFVPPQDQLHQYLLFRGCDIKDLHVHENASSADSKADLPPDPAILSTDEPPEVKAEEEAKDNDKDTNANTAKEAGADDKAETANKTKPPSKDAMKGNEVNGAAKETMTKPKKEIANNAAPTSASAPKRAPRRKKNNNSKGKQMVGSGASLLNRKARGVVEGANGPDKDMDKDFDFESNLAEFTKSDSEEDDYNLEEEESGTAYSKDDFFDSLSNDVVDRQMGKDNRLRGAAERSLNTETFGATSLGNNRRYRGRGRGRGYRGRGRGSGRGGRGGRGRGGRKYGDGGLSAGGGDSSRGSWRTAN